MNYRSMRNSTQDLWTWELPSDIETVVGIPRSGLLAANILALHTNVGLKTVERLLQGELIQGGQRSPDHRGDFLHQPRKVLVIDDSLLTGSQMTRVRKRLMPLARFHSTPYAAVYIQQPGNEQLVDCFYEVLPTSSVFAWNVTHHIILTRSCVDIDGVLCRDASENEDDDGPAYTDFITNVQPKCVPTARIRYLVTCRLEKCRRLTEEWLSRHGIMYDRLVMMDFSTTAARTASGAHANYKPSVYKMTDALLFIESSLDQAYEIGRLSGARGG